MSATFAHLDLELEEQSVLTIFLGGSKCYFIKDGGLCSQQPKTFGTTTG